MDNGFIIRSSAVLLSMMLSLGGCATVPVSAPPVPPKPPGFSGFYHTLEKGQTLWRVSKMYNVDLEELVRLNGIATPSTLEIGQKILVPASKDKPHLPPPQQVISAAEDFQWPVRGPVLARFGSTINEITVKGLRIQAETGTAILAARSGMVVFYDPNLKGFGSTIIIDHGDGLHTVYAPAGEPDVSVGVRVRQGERIARVGKTAPGERTYLYFEIRRGATPQNPYYFLSNS